MSTQIDVRQRIRDDIVQGVWPFGARITIAELATRYGVSHMPVREALRDLQGEALVIIEPNRGARIRDVDARFVANLFEMRAALEVTLIRQAAKRCVPADVAALADIQETLESHIERRDYAAVITENHRFHQAINRMTENPQAIELVDRHWTLVAALWRHYGYGEERFAGVANDHRHLIDALKENDAEAAAVIMNAHVIKARQNLLERVRAQESSEHAAYLWERAQRRKKA